MMISGFPSITHFALILCILLPTRTTLADTANPSGDSIATDRPDVAESSQTVGAMRLQLELGFDFETTNIAGSRLHSLRTPMKIRFGLLDWWEVHIESDWFAYDSGENAIGDVDRTGLSDIDLGTKLHLLDQAGWVPSLGVLLAVGLPLGSDGVSDESVLLIPTVAADWEITDTWGVGANLGSTHPLTERTTTSDAIRYALAIGRTWSPLNDDLRTYVEFFGETLTEDSTSALYVDGGFSWLVTPLVQLDINVRVGLTDSAADVGTGMGLSFKI